ncbi:heterokaryon incompatibility protein-domain-containing protein [Triangularia verruculosa]|uniref:Heterokaryon incompatibility protein-domain-containing protein n=1 Tax=Triangularia verruculosa TaxID=2587418 RepID=A0AAN6XNC8_9PEZI|nr:heterokaryon incompatibility protein-domain-containing protein [Triangularia verruculosa]
MRTLSPGTFAHNPTSILCHKCTSRMLLSLEPQRESIRDIKFASSLCDLHKLLYDICLVTLLKDIKDETTLVEMQRLGSHVFLNGMPDPVLSLCWGPGKPNGPQWRNREVFEEIQIGLPVVLSTGSPENFELLTTWLKDCDINHPNCYLDNDTSRRSHTLPTRLLDLGTCNDEVDQSSILLFLSSSLVAKKEEIRYIALSHPWGDSRKHVHFSTTATNVNSHLTTGISLSHLPQTFRDAVTVTRALGIRYLWVDSLCIVQGAQGDFESEAQKMEAVFSMAYCVLAASRAEGTTSGFLSSRPSRRFVAVNLDVGAGKQHGNLAKRNAEENTIYVCEAIDNFQADVIDGPLNQRGWVLQERALARRTIYFTERQTYFECGGGVRCETLTKMTNNQSSFLGDPNFPQVALTSSKGGKIRLYESLYKTYSRLQFTRAYDRPIAIAGLEQRLVAAFDTRGGYGIFDRVPFFGRSLLWTCEETGGMQRIEFPKEGLGRYRVPPSWSWMAYTGAIGFMDLPFDGVHWLEDDVRSPWGAAVWEMNLETSGSGSSTSSSMWHTGRADQDNNLTGRGRKLNVNLKTAEEKIKWDIGKRPDDVENDLRVVAVGRRKSRTNKPTTALEHHVLVVVAVDGKAENGGTRRYERVGIGSLPGNWITHDEQEEEIAIF